MKYIGLDAHSSICNFSVMDESGKKIDNMVIETNGRLLVNYIRSIGGDKSIAFEECELSSWLYSILRKEVTELVVCNPVVNVQYKSKKNDKIDATKLANLLRGGFLEKVYHDGSEREMFRSLVSGYQDLIEEAVRLKCRYKSLFRKEGNKQTGELLYRDESFLKDLKRADFKFIGEGTYNILTCLDKERMRYVEEIKKQSKKFREIKYLKSIPGIGEIQAAKIVSQVIDPKRFGNKYKYYAYCGLARHENRSADKRYGSTRIWGNRILKCVYKMAGHSVLKGDSGLCKYYVKQRALGVSHEDAYNGVCRQIAAISLSVWRNNRKYSDSYFIEKNFK